MPALNIAQYLFSVERRSGHRDEVRLSTTLRALGTDHDCELVNLSPSGFMVRCQAPVVDDARVVLALPRHGGLRGRVVWVLGGRIGCEMVVPIANDDYPRLLASLPRA